LLAMLVISAEVGERYLIDVAGCCAGVSVKHGTEGGCGDIPLNALGSLFEAVNE